MAGRASAAPAADEWLVLAELKPAGRGSGREAGGLRLSALCNGCLMAHGPWLATALVQPARSGSSIAYPTAQDTAARPGQRGVRFNCTSLPSADL